MAASLPRAIWRGRANCPQSVVRWTRSAGTYSNAFRPRKRLSYHKPIEEIGELLLR